MSCGVERGVRGFGHARLADQRRGEPLPMVHVIEAVAALHAQPAAVGRAVAPGDVQNPVVLDVIGEQAAYAAVGADRVDGLVGFQQPHAAGRHERAGRARLHAFAAAHAGTGAYRVGHVEDDGGLAPAVGVADHVVDLFFAAGALAARALDADVQIDGNRGMRNVRLGLPAHGEAGRSDLERLGPGVQFPSAAYARLRPYPTAAVRARVSGNVAPARCVWRPACRPAGFDNTTRPAAVRLLFPPHRRGSCRPAAARPCSTGGEFPRRGDAQLVGSFRPGGRRPRGRPDGRR